jgi:transposase
MPKIDGRALDHSLSEHLRMMAVRRVVEDGERPSDVMRSMGLHRTSIYPWLQTYHQCGYEGLKGTKAAGPTPKLSEKQCAKVRKWIVGKDPRQYGFDFGLWTRSIIRALIKDRFAVEVSLATVGGLLARLGITPQRPLRRAYERDPAAIEHWVQTEYPELRARAKSHGAAIFFLDEAGFSSEPNLGRTYGQKGETPVVRTTGQRQKVSAISAVNAKGAFWCSVYTGMLNAERFVEFLQDFLQTRRGKVYLVVDGHPSHRAKKVQQFVQSTGGRLELHFLPPYAPDLNPDEFVWQYAKTNGIAKKPLKQGESLRERVEADLDTIAKNKPLIRSFFQAKSVVYAADL